MFAKDKLILKIYTLIKALPIIKQVKIIDQKRIYNSYFRPNLIKKTFIIYLAYFNKKILIYFAYKTLITLLMVKKVTIPAQYLDFANLFLNKLAIKFFRHFNINKYLINLKSNKHLYYRLSYSPRLVKLKIIKIYVKINLAIILFAYLNLLPKLLSYLFKSLIAFFAYI